MSEVWAWLALVVGAARDVSLLRTTPEMITGRWSVPIGIAVVAALSGLVGKAGLLVVNQVRVRDFGITWLLESLRLLFAMALQGAVLWGCAHLALPQRAPDLAGVTHIVLYATAPLWFSAIAIAPYIGPLVERVLLGWVLVALWALMDAAMPQASAWETLAVVLAGWLAYFLASRLLEPVTLWLQRGIWRRVMGRPLRMSAQELLAAASPRQLAEEHLPPHQCPPSGVAR